MRILLVEDDKGVVRFVSKGLLENSFSVDVAYNGEEGLTSDRSPFRPATKSFPSLSSRPEETAPMSPVSRAGDLLSSLSIYP